MEGGGAVGERLFVGDLIGEYVAVVLVTFIYTNIIKHCYTMTITLCLEVVTHLHHYYRTHNRLILPDESDRWEGRIADCHMTGTHY